MIRYLGRKKYNIFAFDLESHNDDESIAKKETSMWLGCLIDEKSTVDDESIYFYDMDSFISHLEQLSTPKRKNAHESRKCKNICIYIYNLSFEWSFILPVLLERGYTFSETIAKDSEKVFNSVSTKTCSSVWTASVKFSKSSGIILFRDLAKIFGGGLSKVAKSFNLETQKGEIDYRLNRLHNHVVTKEEKEYVFKDVRIIVDILLKMNEKDDNDFWSSTSIAGYSMRKMIKFAYPRALKPYAEYRKDYPQLDDLENTFLRNSVGGGITYAPSRYQFKEINEKIIHVDAHNMHPTQMYKKLFPYGYGEYFTGKPKNDFFRINCCHIKVSYTGVKLHSIIQLIGINFISDYDLTVWDFEIPTMMKCYEDLEIKYIDGYSYKSKPATFRRYPEFNYKKRNEAKLNNDAYNYMRYKLLNNSSYGKLLERPHNEIIENCLDQYGIINSKVHLKPSNELKTNARYTYLPLGSCIPAYSRVDLIEHALLMGYENIVYFDTDSIFAIYNNKTKTSWEKDFNHDEFLGGWALEEIIDRFQVTAPKRYKKETDGVTEIKAGGINFSKYISDRAKELNVDESEYSVSFDEINIISSKWQVQRAYRVRGGTIIEFETKEMSVADKYKEIFANNKLNVYNLDMLDMLDDF